MHFFKFLKKSFKNFLWISSVYCVFRPKAQKFNAWFVRFFEKSAKIIHFRDFLKKIFANFRKFSQNFIWSNNTLSRFSCQFFLIFESVPPPKKNPGNAHEGKYSFPNLRQSIGNIRKNEKNWESRQNDNRKILA